jgi:Holliday junction resolvase RusA-like endonuclease
VTATLSIEVDDTPDSLHLHLWRTSVYDTARKHLIAHSIRFPNAVRVNMVFRIARPEHHYIKDPRKLRDTAPQWPTTLRNIGDPLQLESDTIRALTAAGVLETDSQIIQMRSTKTWADGITTPGATILITELL